MGHIPTMDTRAIENVDFYAELTRSVQPSAEYDVEKWLFVPNFYTEYRYILGTRGQNPLICIGINPSTARPDALDNTLKSVERIAKANGFDSFIMFNVYPQRATDPDQMDKAMDRRLHEENMKAFAYILSLSQTPTVWAAWGTVICKRPYLKECVQDMIAVGEQHRTRWVCAGKCSKAGHPHHPLYLKKEEPVRDFDIRAYTELL